MRRHTKAVALVAASAVLATALGSFGSASAQSGPATRLCTWGGTPANPTGIVTFEPGITNTPSAGPIAVYASGRLEGEGCKGTMIFDKHGWHIRDGAEASDKTRESERAHYRNFLDCIKTGKRPNADIEEGHKSTRLCHLGNIALRVGRVLHFNEKTETLVNDPEANQLLGRSYRKPFEVPEKV